MAQELPTQHSKSVWRTVTAKIFSLCSRHVCKRDEKGLPPLIINHPHMIPNLTEEQYSAIGKIIIAYNNIELMLRYAYGWLIFDVDDGLAVTEIMPTSTDNLCAGIRYLLLKRCNKLAVDDFDLVVRKIAIIKEQRNKLAHSFVVSNKNGDDIFLKIQKSGSPKKKKSLKDFLKTTSYDISELQKIVEETDKTVQETIRFVKKLQEFIETNFRFQSTTDTNFQTEQPHE